LTLITLACVGFAGAIPNLTAASADVVPAHRRGVGFAMLQLVTTLGGAAGPLAIGLLSDAVGSLRIALLALVPPLFGAIALLSRTTKHFDEDARAAIED
jgi:MFS family permease